MPPWLLKAAVQGAISIAPASHQLNFLLQRHVTKAVNLRERTFVNKLGHCANHLEHYRRFAQRELPNSVLELGTGWHPIVPIAMYLCGVPQVYTIDISSLMQPTTIAQTIQYFAKFAQNGELVKHLPLAQADRIAHIQHIEPTMDILKQCHIISIIGDARHLDLNGQRVDLLVSNNTLEHIPGNIIGGIFRAYHAIASDSGVMSHFIDLTDHYSHFDKTITPYHFLRYGEGRWRFLNNSLHYQNRMRVSDYREIHAQAGFRIVHEKNQTGTPEAIREIQVAPEFARYSQDDLTVILSWMVSMPV